MLMKADKLPSRCQLDHLSSRPPWHHLHLLPNGTKMEKEAQASISNHVEFYGDPGR